MELGDWGIKHPESGILDEIKYHERFDTQNRRLGDIAI